MRWECLLLLCASIIWLSWLTPNPWLFSVEIHKYDKEADAVCQSITKKMARNEDIRFFVSYSLVTLILEANVGFEGRYVYFSPPTIKHQYFPETVAHELGHIEYNTGNQIMADLFAMKVFP